ncbi:MAG: hypothetical protein NTU91_15940 [Chloroflexi bacterium]|nr:hypothetical protein [Chloroflexota bacterium]
MSLCLAIAGLGAAALRTVLGRLTILDVLALSFPLGAGFLTWFLFLMSWAGDGVTPLSVGLVWGLLLALALAARVLTAPRACADQTAGCPHRSTRLAPMRLPGLLVVLIGLTGFAAWLGVNGSYYGWDDMAIWAVKGYGIAREGSIWAAGHWGDHGLGYPMNIPLLIAIFRFTGDKLPASKIVFPIFYLSLAVGCLRFWLERGIRPRSAFLGTLLLVSTPLLFEHATLGYANLPYTVYLVLGCVEFVQGSVTQDVRRQVLSGLLLGMAAWTRPEGALAVASVVVVLGLTAHWIRQRGLNLLAWVLPVAVLAGTWVVFAGIHAPGGQMREALGAASEAVAGGVFHLSAFYWIVRFMGRQAVEISVWGVLPVACAVLLFLGARRLGPRSNPDAFLVSTAFLMVAAGVTVQFYLADFLGLLMNYLGNSANRMYMPAAVLAVLLAVLSSRSAVGEILPSEALGAQGTILPTGSE